MADNEKKYVRRRHPDLNIESIISAPLIAVSKANAMMVTGQTRFLLDYCFTKITEKVVDPTTNKTVKKSKYKPILIEMMMTKSDLKPAEGMEGEANYTPARIEYTELSFNVPLLCIVPISNLAIDKVDFDFNLHITSITTYNNDGPIEKKAQLNGKISAQDSTNSKYNMEKTEDLKLNISAKQLPLPKGVLSILDLYTKNIHLNATDKK